ncbi:MAG: Mpo1-like protein [Gammaproteobacteria bacterium]
MKPVQAWLDEYGESHQDPTNKAVHWVCVPLIALSLIGMLWALPVPAGFLNISPVLNWGVLFMMASVVYYFLLSPRLAVGMVGVMAVFTVALYWLDGLQTPLWMLCVGIFVLAWIGQFIGHLIEGKRPSFFQDLQFLMIGPMWLLSFVYQRLGIRY